MPSRPSPEPKPGPKARIIELRFSGYPPGELVRPKGARDRFRFDVLAGRRMEVTLGREPGKGRIVLPFEKPGGEPSDLIDKEHCTLELDNTGGELKIGLFGMSSRGTGVGTEHEGRRRSTALLGVGPFLPSLSSGDHLFFGHRTAIGKRGESPRLSYKEYTGEDGKPAKGWFLTTTRGKKTREIFLPHVEIIHSEKK